jgi:hypothetical protein
MKRKAVFVLCLLLSFSCFFHENFGYVGVSGSQIYLIHNISTGLNYTSIQAAIDAPETVDGNTILVDAGTFNETPVVDKSLTMIGSGRNSTVIDGRGGGMVIHVVVNEVLIRGFAVKNGFLGVYFDHSSNSIFRENGVSDMTYYYAIYASYSDNLTMDQNIVGPNSCSGVLITNSLGFRVLNNDVHGNEGYGINANASIDGLIMDNDVYGNSYDGIGLSKGSRNITVAGNNVRDSVFGFGLDVIDPDCLDNVIYDNNFMNNSKQASVFSPNRWDDGLEGNYWSDYAGTDQDHDGIGDTPYRLNENNTDDYPLMGVFSIFKTASGFDMDVVSNSSITAFAYFVSNGTIRMHVLSKTVTQTFGFCRVRIPHGLMTEPYNVTVDGVNPLYWNYTLYDDGDSRWIYFLYQQSEHEVLIQGRPPPPTVSIILPQNQTYGTSDVPLAFTVNEDASWLAYSLDGQNNVTISGNTTLGVASKGAHTVVVYARNSFGDTSASGLAYFSTSVSAGGVFPFWAPVTAVVLAVILVGVLVYLRKLRRRSRDSG